MTQQTTQSLFTFLNAFTTAFTANSTKNAPTHTSGFFITRHAIGKADTVPLVPESVDGGEPPTIDQQALEDYINGVRSISWWRPKYGAILDASKLEGRR